MRKRSRRRFWTKKKVRRVPEITSTTITTVGFSPHRSVYNSTSESGYRLQNDHVGKTKGWEENLELKIRMPPDLMGGPLGGVAVMSASTTSGKTPLTESECKIYLIITLSVALTFCVLSAVIVLVACFKRYQEVTSGDKKRKMAAAAAAAKAKSDEPKDSTTVSRVEKCYWPNICRKFWKFLSFFCSNTKRLTTSSS